MAKTTLKKSPVPEIIKPTGVQTTGPKVTPELEKTMTKTKFGSQPVIQPTAQEISATNEQRANQQQAEANKLMDLSKNIDNSLGITQKTPEVKAPEIQTQTNLQTGETKPVVPIINEAGNQINLTPQEAQMRDKNLANVEKTTVQTPEGTTTTTKETPKPTGITKETQWKDVLDKNLSNAEQLIEARYGVVASQKDGKIIANIGGQNYEWILDGAGNLNKSASQSTMKSGDIYTQLLQNPNIDTSNLDQNEVKTAKERLSNYNRYKNYTVDQIGTAMKNGDLLAGTTVYNDLMNDPVIKAKIEEASMLKTIKGETIDKEKVEIRKSEEILSNPTIAQIMQDNQITAEELNAMTETPEIVAKRKEKESREKEYLELKSTYDAIDDEVESEFKGSNATSSDLAQIKANRRKGIYKDLQLSYSLYESSLGQLTDMKKESMNLFATNLGLYKDKQAQDQATANKLEDRAYQEELTKKNFLFENGDLNSADPFIQQRGIENAVNKMYEQYQIPMTETPQEKIARVKEMIAQGMSPEQAISTIRGEITNSERYKNAMKAYNQGLQPNQAQDWQKLSDNSLYNQKTGEIKNISNSGSNGIGLGNSFIGAAGDTESTSLLNASDGQIIPSRLSETTNPNNGKECAEYVNDIAGQSLFGSLYEDKTKVAKETTGGIGKAMVWKPTNTGAFAKYGHVGIIVGEQGNNWIVRSSNIKGDGAISTDIVPKSASSNYKTLKNVSIQPQVEQNQVKPLTDKQYTQYNQAYSKFLSTPGVKNFEDALSSGGDLIASLKSENGPGDVGAVFQFMKTLDPASTVREGEFALAENTAGLSGKFTNLLNKVVSGERLSDEQRKAFGRIAFEYIKNKGKIYDIKYNDLVKILKNQGIQESFYPTKMTDYINNFEGNSTFNSPVTQTSSESDYLTSLGY